jgi:hypothetical protein
MRAMSKIELHFRIGSYNGTMQMTIFVNDVLVQDYKEFDSEYVKFSHDIPWPCKIKILLSGKNLLCDTNVNSDGKIVADKFVELKKIIVDRCEVAAPYMKSIQLDTDDQSINTLYWGFNGIVALNFEQDDSFTWHLLQRKIADNIYVIEQTKM